MAQVGAVVCDDIFYVWTRPWNVWYRIERVCGHTLPILLMYNQSYWVVHCQHSMWLWWSGISIIFYLHFISFPLHLISSPLLSWKCCSPSFFSISTWLMHLWTSDITNMTNTLYSRTWYLHKKTRALVYVKICWPHPDPPLPPDPPTEDPTHPAAYYLNPNSSYFLISTEPVPPTGWSLTLH